MYPSIDNPLELPARALRFAGAASDEPRMLKKTGFLTGVVLLGVVLSFPLWKSEAKKRSKWVVVATNVYQDGIRRLGVRGGQIGDPYVAQHEASEIPSFLKRISETYATYEHHLGPKVATRRVLEIGPGDNIGVALRFASAGAAHVTVIDKFVPLQLSDFHRQLYGAVRAGLPEHQQSSFDQTITLSPELRPNPARLTYITRGIEDAGELIAPESIDIVVSNAVLEEVFEIDRMFDEIDRALVPGGMQIHKIDLSDYGMFSSLGYHPLEFLTLPDGLYRYMVESSGQPNRRMVDYYRDKMKALGYEARIFVTWVLGARSELQPPVELPAPSTVLAGNARAQIEAVRGRLIERYQRLSDEDLAVQGILLVARKPAASSSSGSTTTQHTPVR